MTEAAGTHDAPVVEARDLCIVRGGARTCEFATFAAHPGEVVVLAAAEVAPVRDALLAVAGLIAPAEGSLSVAGTELAARPARGPLRLRPRLPRGTVGVGVVSGVCDAVSAETVGDALAREFSLWQRRRRATDVTAASNVADAANVAGATADASAAGKSSTSDAAGDVIDYLGRFELAGDIGRTVGALDPAHRARLSAALAFACRPAAAVLDLTDAFVRGLSQDEAFAFLRLLAHIASEERAAVLVGTTDSAVARVVTRAFALDIDSAELLNANDPSAGSDGVSGAYI